MDVRKMTAIFVRQTFSTCIAKHPTRILKKVQLGSNVDTRQDERRRKNEDEKKVK